MYNIFGDVMNKKMFYLIIVVLFMGMLIIGGSVNSDDDVLVDGDYDTSFYVEDSNNLFIKLAKILDNCCYFAVDIIISGINTVFDIILGR